MSRDIIQSAAENTSDTCRDFRRGVIISPAAIGDCLLMLPLARFMKERLRLGSIDMIGHCDYVGFYPGRTGGLYPAPGQQIRTETICANT